MTTFSQFQNVSGDENVFSTALAGQDIAKMSDASIIQAVYAERRRVDENGNLVYFSSSSPDVQAGVSKRFVSEEKEALERLGAQ